MSSHFPGLPSIQQTYKLAKALRDTNYPGQECIMELEDMGTDFRGKVRRLSDNDTSYTMLVPKT